MEEDYIIGLDIGSNSVGWAVVSCIQKDGKWYPTNLVNLNSYIFREVVESKTQVPLNAIRRQKRLARRQCKRRARRRGELVALLRKYKLVPEGDSTFSELQANLIDQKFASRVANDDEDSKKYQNPFAIRAIGIEQELETHELGRAILHLQSHRGYRSNEGAKYIELLERLNLEEKKMEDQDNDNEDQDAKKERKQVLGGISALEKEMRKNKVQTVGQYVWHRMKNGEQLNRITGFSVRYSETNKDNEEVQRDVALYARRDMTSNEFDLLWEKQRQVVQKTLSKNKVTEQVDDVRDKIKDTLFEQYPVQSPPPPKRRLPHLSYNAVGKCSLEPRKNRCRAAWPEAQEFRTRQVINNIKKGGNYLSIEEKDTLFQAANKIAKLNADGRLSWSKVAQCLKCEKEELNYPDEGDLKSGLIGDRTGKKISSILNSADYGKHLKEYKDANAANDGKAKITMLEAMLTIVNKRALYDHLVNKHGLTEGKDGNALALTMLELEPSYMKYSLKAIRKLLPHLREGKNLHEAKAACGYEHEDTISRKRTDNSNIYLNKSVPQIANPRVQKAVYATRRVVNAIIERHGRRPVQINIEMARDLKANKNERASITKQNAANRKSNIKAGQELETNKEFPITPNRNNVNKYKCWHDEQDYKCAYCGKPMSWAEVFQRGEWEHILPQSEFKQNYMNRVVSCWDCNRKKGDRTPYETWGDDLEIWPRIKDNMAKWRNMPKQKKRRILNTQSIADSEDFCERALKDTQYITTVVSKYFEQQEKIPVQASRGMATSELRYRWGLNNILPNPDAKPSDDKEKVRIDHRHHAIDAFVVAMTNHKSLMNLTKYMQYKRDKQHGDSEGIRLERNKELNDMLVPSTWQGGDIHRAVEDMLLKKNVAIQKKTRVEGALHEETVYGRSHYTATENSEKISNTRMGEILEHEPDSNGLITDDGDIEWINDRAVYEKVKAWHEENRNKPAQKRTPLPMHELPIARRCYTHRIKLEGAIGYVKSKKWEPGKSKKWIADQELHNVLYRWKEENNLLQATEKQIASVMEDVPLKMPTNKVGEQGNAIKKITVATIMGSVRHISQRGIVQLGNNHHMDIFFNATSDTRKVRIASAIDVAMRQSKRRSIIDKTPDPNWGDGWKYQTTIHEGDLVTLDTEDPLISNRVKDTAKGNARTYKTNIYRVQTMSITANGSPDVRFRLVSIATVKDDYGLVRVRTANDMAIKHIALGVLGS